VLARGLFLVRAEREVKVVVMRRAMRHQMMCFLRMKRKRVVMPRMVVRVLTTSKTFRAMLYFHVYRLSVIRRKSTSKSSEACRKKKVKREIEGR